MWRRGYRAGRGGDSAENELETELAQKLHVYASEIWLESHPVHSFFRLQRGRERETTLGILVRFAFFELTHSCIR